MSDISTQVYSRSSERRDGPVEREEAKEIWSQVHSVKEGMSDIRTDLRIVDHRLSMQERLLQDSNSRVTASFEALTAEIRALREGLLTLKTQDATKKGIIDRWGGHIIAALTLAVAFLAYEATQDHKKQKAQKLSFPPVTVQAETFTHPDERYSYGSSNRP